MAGRGRPRIIRGEAIVVGDTGESVGIGGSDGSGIDGETVVDPGTVRASDGTSPGGETGGELPKRRGRKPGSTTKKNTPLDITRLEAMLLSIHTMLATFSKTPELELAKEEAEWLAKGIGEVADYYPAMKKLQSLGQIGAWANLGMAIATIYGPRVTVMRMRKAEEARMPRSYDLGINS